MLLCAGTKDIQVSVDRDILPLFLFASQSGVPIELNLFATLGHLMKRVEAGASPTQLFAKAVDRGFLAALLAWLEFHGEQNRPQPTK